MSVIIWLEDICQDVQFYDYEPFAIKYRGTDEQVRNYYPDFLIWWKFTKRGMLVEVKNDYMMKSGINMRKDEQAIVYAAEHGLDYAWWGDDKIQSLQVDLGKYKDDPRIKVDHGSI